MPWSADSSPYKQNSSTEVTVQNNLSILRWIFFSHCAIIPDLLHHLQHTCSFICGLSRFSFCDPKLKTDHDHSFNCGLRNSSPVKMFFIFLTEMMLILGGIRDSPHSAGMSLFTHCVCDTAD